MIVELTQRLMAASLLVLQQPVQSNLLIPALRKATQALQPAARELR